MSKNENGFSLIELAVACAIMATLMTMGAIQLNGVADSIKAQAQEAHEAQQNAYDNLLGATN